MICKIANLNKNKGNQSISIDITKSERGYDDYNSAVGQLNQVEIKQEEQIRQTKHTEPRVTNRATGADRTPTQNFRKKNHFSTDFIPFSNRLFQLDTHRHIAFVRSEEEASEEERKQKNATTTGEKKPKKSTHQN